MKTNKGTKKSTGRKLLVLALAFMMIMQYNCLALTTAWADTEEIAQEEQITEVNEEVKEEVKEEIKAEAPKEAKTEVKAEAKAEVQTEAKVETKTEAPKEVKAEVPQEAKTETAQEAPKEEIKAEQPEEVKAEVKNEQPKEAVKAEAAPNEMTQVPAEEAAKAPEEVEEAAQIEEEEEVKGPALAEKEDSLLTVHITNILYINRNRPESSVNGKAVPWENTFTISKNGSKAIAHNGTYSFVGGATATASGQGFKAKFLKGFVLATPRSGIVRGDSLDGFKTIQRIANTKGETVTVTFTDGSTKVFTEADIYISPVYSIEESWVLYYNMIDLVSTGSGSWSNENGSATSYTKTFKDPSVATPKAHYQFINWFNTDKNEYFAAGEKDKYTSNMFKSGEKRTVNVYALWQPSVTVNYNVLGKDVRSTENFTGVGVYDYIPEAAMNTEFDGWYDAAGNRLDETKVYDAPAITGLGEKADPAVYTVYARFTTTHTVSKVWDDQNREDSLRSDEIGTVLTANSSETELTATLNEENGWSYTFTGLDAYDKDNNLISYAADETTILEGYTKVIDSVSDAVNTVITNIFMPEITLTAGSGSWTFDGEEHHNSEVEITDGYLYEGDELVAATTGTVVNVEDTAEGNNVVSEYRIMRGEADVTGMYRINLEAGTLEITPAPVIVPEEIDEPEAPAEEPAEEPAAPAEEDDDDDEKIPAVNTKPAAPQTANTVSEAASMTDTATGTISEAEIPENAAPLAAPEAEIAEEAAPLAASGAWALINLFEMILSAIISLALLLTYFTRRDERNYEAMPQAAEGGDEESKEWNRKGLLRILSLIPAALSIILFVMTEDMTQPMYLTDKWTLVMTVLLLITAVMAILSKKTEKEVEEEAQA